MASEEEVRPYLTWSDESTVMAYYMDVKDQYLIGKRCTCDIFVRDPNLLDVHAKITRQFDQFFTLTSLRSCTMTVNGRRLSPSFATDLQPGDVICFGNRLRGIRVTFQNGRVRGGDVLRADSSRPYLTWDTAEHTGIYYLDRKSVFIIGNERNSDLVLNNGKLMGVRIRIMCQEGDTRDYSVVLSSRLRNATLDVNGESVAWRERRSIENGDTFTLKNDTGSVCFRFACPTTSSNHATTSAAPATNVAPTTPHSERQRRSARRSPAEIARGVLCSTPVRAPTAADRRATPVLRSGRRRETPLQRSNPPLFLLCSSLQEMLTCCVCLGIFYKPATVMPCCHKFCFTCIKEWDRQEQALHRCPQCRGIIIDIAEDPLLKDVVEVFYVARPDLRPTREELQSMDSLAAQFRREEAEHRPNPPVVRFEHRRFPDGSNLRIRIFRH